MPVASQSTVSTQTIAHVAKADVSNNSAVFVFEIARAKSAALHAAISFSSVSTVAHASDTQATVYRTTDANPLSSTTSDISTSSHGVHGTGSTGGSVVVALVPLVAFVVALVTLFDLGKPVRSQLVGRFSWSYWQNSPAASQRQSCGPSPMN